MITVQILWLILIMVKYISTLSTTTETTKATYSTESTTDSYNATDDGNRTPIEYQEPPGNYTFPPGFTAPTGKTMFPPGFYLSTTGKSPETTILDRYIFESVDYEQILQKLKNDYKDCYGQHIRCVRHRTDHAPVCGYNLRSGHFDDYYGPCEIDLQNCYQRMKDGFGVYGTNYRNDIIFYNGEGYNCIYYLRMARTQKEMEELYFGDEIYRIQENRKIYF